MTDSSLTDRHTLDYAALMPTATAASVSLPPLLSASERPGGATFVMGTKESFTSVAKALDYAPSAVSRILRGERNTSTDFIVRCAEFLKVSPAALAQRLMEARALAQRKTKRRRARRPARGRQARRRH